MSITINELDSRLKNYMDANGTEILADAVFSSKTAQLMNVQTGVTAEQPIVVLSTSIIFGDADTCGFEANGDDELTNRTLKPEYLKVNKTFCPKTMLNSFKHNEVKMNALGQKEAIPFEATLLNANVETIGSEVEKLIWSGNTAKTGNISKLDGIITIATNDENVEVVAKGEKTVYQRCQDLYMAWDSTINYQPVIWMSLSNYKKLTTELVNANLYHVYEKQEGQNFEMVLPGTSITIKGVTGIVGEYEDVIVMTPQENLYYGCDLENDIETVDFYWNPSTREFNFVCEFAIAVNYAYSNKVLLNK